MLSRRRREMMAWSVAGCSLIAAVAAIAADDEPKAEYAVSGRGSRWLDSGSGIKVKMLVEQSNLAGSEVEFGEITFPADYANSPPHRHQSVEIFYVLSGKLGHTVNNEKHVIEPGMVGIVRPGDVIVHSVESDEPVKAIVIWTPAGEADRLTKLGVFKPRAIEEE